MAQIKKKVKILQKQTTKKSKWWLWLFLAVVAIVAVVFFLKNTSQENNNEIVSSKIEQAITKVNEIAIDVQNGNLDNAQSKVEEVQAEVDEANANAKTEMEKQEVAEVQAKVDEVRQSVEKATANSKVETPTNDSVVTSERQETETPKASEQSVSKSVTPDKVASEKVATTPYQKGQSTNTKPKANTESISTMPNESLDEKAKQVIRGDFGNGIDRKNALGEDYRQIQDKVNELYKNGTIF